MENTNFTTIFFSNLEKQFPNLTSLYHIPATKEDFDILEEKRNIAIPQDYRELYSVHNGEGEETLGIMAGFKWLSIQEASENYEVLLDSPLEILSHSVGKVREGNYRKSWIPLAEDSSGAFIVMDLDPGETGVFGQIITIDDSCGDSFVIADNLESFFQLILKWIADSQLKWRKEDISYFEWCNGHFFNSLPFPSSDDEWIPITGFWSDYFNIDPGEKQIKRRILERTTMIIVTRKDVHSELTLDFLSNLPNLKELIIHSSSVTEFAPIQNILSLRKLIIINDSFQTSDLQYITSLPNLKEVTLDSFAINSILPLSSSCSLRVLNVLDSCKIDISELKGFPKLKKLRLEHLLSYDYSVLKYLTKLTELEIKDKHIYSLDFLQFLTKLKIFTSDTKADNEDGLIYLNQMPHLKEFMYPIGDFSVVENCKQLNHIGVDPKRQINLEVLQLLSISSITIIHVSSKEEAEAAIHKVREYCKPLAATGFSIKI